MKTTSITIGIPTLNRVKDVKMFLTCVSHFLVYPDKIIICDQSDDDQTRILVEKSKQHLQQIEIAYIKSKIKSLVQSRNIIIDNTDTTYLIMVDDDAIIPPDFIGNLKRRLRPNVKAINIRLIESRQYGKLFSDYRDFADNIRKITNHIDQFSIGERIIQLANYITLNNCYRRGQMRFNRIMRVNGDYGCRKNIKGEVLSGFTILKNEVYSKFQFDEKFDKGYCLTEDQEYAIRVSREHPVYMFDDVWIYHNRDLSDINRLKESKLVESLYNNTYYIFYKHVQKSVSNVLLFLYSRISFCMIQTMKALYLKNHQIIPKHWKELFKTITRTVKLSPPKHN